MNNSFLYTYTREPSDLRHNGWQTPREAHARDELLDFDRTQEYLQRVQDNKARLNGRRVLECTAL